MTTQRTRYRNVFSIFSVWHRLTTLFDAVDDPRVPIFQTYMHVTAYVLTIIWAIVRPALTFRSVYSFLILCHHANDLDIDI